MAHEKDRVCQLQIRVLGMLAKHARDRETLRYPAEIVRWLEEQGDDAARISPVSRVLQQFEERGWVTSRPENPEDPKRSKRFYTLTPLGARMLGKLGVKAQQQNNWVMRSVVEGLEALTR